MLRESINECSICLSEIENITTTDCNHSYCKKCIDDCLDNKPECPLCRKNIKYLKNDKETIRVVRYNNINASNNRVINPEPFMYNYSRYKVYRFGVTLSFTYILYQLYKISALNYIIEINDKKIAECINNNTELENTISNNSYNNIHMAMSNLIHICKIPIKYFNNCINN
uniref:RING-type domain-containing protein n=1 Tax=viral metagenome TaxID=1070528 RepID=A0A6C0CXA3_9ZZZZ